MKERMQADLVRTIAASEQMLAKASCDYTPLGPCPDHCMGDFDPCICTIVLKKAVTENATDPSEDRY